MSVTIHCEILRNNKHENFIKHMAVNEACLADGVKKLPVETAEYFGSSLPECHSEMERQALVIERDKLSEGTVSDLEHDYRTGYDIDVTKLRPTRRSSECSWAVKTSL